MTHGSLFSGIGGFDYAAELMGWENKFHCEKEIFCNTILNYYWPNAISYDDIKTTDFTIHRGTIDVLTGGFPCQPYSVAGKRKGKNDERHLWPEMLRAIREIQPRWVVGENVRGLINWNGGLVFDEVQADLEAAGYEVIPFVLPAAGVNAPHRRDRIWFVANAGSKQLQGRMHSKQPEKTKRYISSFGTWDGGNTWQDFPTQPPICIGNDGVSAGLSGITFSAWRKESIKGLGNAIVPEVVLQIFRAIEQYENINL